jgi:prevent-host-death family protein
MTITAEPVLYGASYRDLYDSTVAKRELMGIQELRLRIKAVVDAVVGTGVHTVFTRHGKPVAVLVPMDWYRKAAEKMDDPTEL